MTVPLLCLCCCIFRRMWVTWGWLMLSVKPIEINNQRAMRNCSCIELLLLKCRAATFLCAPVNFSILYNKLVHNILEFRAFQQAICETGIDTIMYSASKKYSYFLILFFKLQPQTLVIFHFNLLSKANTKQCIVLNWKEIKVLN